MRSWQLPRAQREWERSAARAAYIRRLDRFSHALAVKKIIWAGEAPAETFGAMMDRFDRTFGDCRELHS